MRVVFFGSGAFGEPTLKRLIEAHEVALVVTQPDRPAGRKRKLTPTPIADLAASHGLPTIKPDLVNAPPVIAQIRSTEPDALVVIAYGGKLGPELLQGLFAINLHGSLLPKYRGAAPINWAMINCERQTGLSVITLARKMDAGAILAQRATLIESMETAGELHDRLAEMGPNLVLETLQAHAAGALRPIEQDESKATQAPKLTKADGTVSFDQPPESVQRRVHGLTPWPGCTVRLGEEHLKILRVKVVADAEIAASEPGSVLDDLTVACAGGAVRLLSVQPPGGKMMSFEAYCRGRRLGEDAVLESL